MQGKTTRRQFLTGAMGLGLAGVAMPGMEMVPAVRVLGDTEALVPGDFIRVVWPWTLDPKRASVVHVANGEESTPMPVPEPTGLVFPRVDIPAIPPDGRLRAGRHEFFLAFEGRYLYLGGFDVRRFRFGC